MAKGSGNEVEIVVKTKDQTAQGAKAARESFKGLDHDSRSLAGGLGKVGERADASEQRVLGMKDTVDGVATIMQGPGKQGIAAYIQGWADLASGLGNFVFPALSAAVGAVKANAVATVKSTAATVAHGAASAAMAVKTTVVRGATMAWTAAQWLLNAALTANPIGLVIVAIAALIAIVVLAYRRSETFRNIVNGAFRSVLAAGRAMWSGLQAVFGFFSTIGARIRAAFAGAASWLLDAGRAIVQGLINGIRNSAGAAVEAAKSMVSGALNAAKSLLGISSPSKVFAQIGQQIGDGLTGGMDSKQRAAAGAGAALAGAARGGSFVPGRAAPGGGGGHVVLEIHSGGSRLDDLLVEVLRKAVRARGGDVQEVLGT